MNRDRSFVMILSKAYRNEYYFSHTLSVNQFLRGQIDNIDQAFLLLSASEGERPD
jgi:hypothetical protein